jgi:uncharacterized membrane protein YeaQ/YmgE (transglycosylase-associated protein family)
MDYAVIAAAGITYGGWIIGWLIIGAIAGAVAGRVMSGHGYGLLGDIVVGIVGAFLGGWLLSLIGLSVSSFWGTLITAFIGACILIALVHAVTGTRTTRYR